MGGQFQHQRLQCLWRLRCQPLLYGLERVLDRRACFATACGRSLATADLACPGQRHGHLVLAKFFLLPDRAIASAVQTAITPCQLHAVVFTAADRGLDAQWLQSV